VRISPKNDDIALARAKRDALERAYDERWASMMLDDDSAKCGIHRLDFERQSVGRRLDARR
jgi:hypothetical protein